MPHLGATPEADGAATVYGVERADTVYGVEPADFTEPQQQQQQAGNGDEEDGGFSQWANDSATAERQHRRQQVGCSSF